MSDDVRRRDQAMQSVAELRIENPGMYGRIISGLEDDIDVKNLLEGLEVGVYKPGNKPEGDLLSAMSNLCIVENWRETSRSNPPYETDKHDLAVEFIECLSEFESYFGSREEVVGAIRAANKLTDGDTISKYEFEELPGSSYKAAISHFGSWNRARFWAGLEIEAEEISSEDIRDRFRKKFHEVEGFPTYDEFLYSDQRMPTETQMKNSDIESYEELCRAEFPARYEKITNYDNPIDLLEKQEFEKGRWMAESENKTGHTVAAE